MFLYWNSNVMCHRKMYNCLYSNISMYSEDFKSLVVIQLKFKELQNFWGLEGTSWDHHVFHHLCRVRGWIVLYLSSQSLNISKTGEFTSLGKPVLVFDDPYSKNIFSSCCNRISYFLISSMRTLLEAQAQTKCMERM